MLTDSEFCCPLCGLVLTSLHAFHQHLAKVHNSRSQQAAVGPGPTAEPGPAAAVGPGPAAEPAAAAASYVNGCPILDDKIEVWS
jgi:hypothetical protein